MIFRTRIPTWCFYPTRMSLVTRKVPESANAKELRTCGGWFVHRYSSLPCSREVLHTRPDEDPPPLPAISGKTKHSLQIRWELCRAFPFLLSTSEGLQPLTLRVRRMHARLLAPGIILASIEEDTPSTKRTSACVGMHLQAQHGRSLERSMRHLEEQVLPSRSWLCHSGGINSSAN